MLGFPHAFQLYWLLVGYRVQDCFDVCIVDLVPHEADCCIVSSCQGFVRFTSLFLDNGEMESSKLERASLIVSRKLDVAVGCLAAEDTVLPEPVTRVVVFVFAMPL